tara:strand:+ start:114 stop:527 length:414 start_codon:yes stop_codon:yes gene_type:complete
MATFYNGGLIKSHDPRFGINHKYITDKLTKHNWKKRAIVRGGLYIYVNDYQKHDGKNPHKKELVYKINGLPKKHKCRKDYKSLNWVLKAANNISNGIEGDYPNEKIAGFKILTPIKGTRIFNSYNKDLLKKRLGGKK